jgi:hypothetical protein
VAFSDGGDGGKGNVLTLVPNPSTERRDVAAGTPAWNP